MTILERINNKIVELKMNSQEELKKTSNTLNIINTAKEALEDEKKLKDYDFSIAINLVNSFGIMDLNQSIQKIKNILVAKYDYNQTFLTIDEDQIQVIKSFKERLGYLKEELEKRIIEQSKVVIDEEVLENLQDLKNLLEGKGRRKYYTYEMIEALFEVLDYDSLNYQDILELINELSVSKNIKGKLTEEKKDLNEVIELFQEYLGDKVSKELLKGYENEICTRIDLVNARGILDFFKENNLLDKFCFPSIVSIAVYGRFEYIKELYFEKVLPKEDKLKELYFSDALTCVWINEKSTKRRHSNMFKKGQEEGKKKTLYSKLNEVCDDDIWENIRILKENESILHQKYDLSNIDYLWVVTKPTWVIKKNIGLFKEFNITDVRMTALAQSDLEEKIHFVIELGLLNTPRTYVFREIEKNVPRYREFMLNGKRKKHYNDNILNYFGRNTSEIYRPSITEYIYWFYKMQRSSKEEFYQDFFSSAVAGKRNKADFYDDNDLELLDNSSKLDELIDENFVTNYYDALIPNYGIYEETIKEYSSSPRGDIVEPFYDKNILSDEILAKLERHVAVDIYSTDGEIRKVNNPYVYVFDRTIISRYKVLRNLSILKNKFGYLNDDMLLTAIVHNSYINMDTFKLIEEMLGKDGLVK